MALRRPHKRMKIASCRGSLAGKKLRRYGVPHPWTPAFAGVASWESIPDRSPGHVFIAIADAGWRRHTKV